jgi:hypothetical protein
MCEILDDEFTDTVNILINGSIITVITDIN